MTAARDAHATHLAAVALDAIGTDILQGQLEVARRLLGDPDGDPYSRRTWDLRAWEIRRELAIRNVRSTLRQEQEAQRFETNVDTLEKFVDRMSDRHPHTCAAIAWALELVERVMPKEDDRG